VYDGTQHVRMIRNFRIGTSLSNRIRIGKSDSNSNRISKLRRSLSKANDFQLSNRTSLRLGLWQCN